MAIKTNLFFASFLKQGAHRQETSVYYDVVFFYGVNETNTLSLQSSLVLTQSILSIKYSKTEF